MGETNPKREELLPAWYMTPQEFKGIMMVLGIQPGEPIAQEEMAEKLGISARQLRRYKEGEAKIPGPVAKLTRRLLRESQE